MTVYDVEEEGGHLFMAMEYLDGGTLRAEIDGKGKLEPRAGGGNRAGGALRAGATRTRWAWCIGTSSPTTSRSSRTGSIKITDFGIARLTFQPNLTMDGQVFGTPSYMSPEQVVGKEIDPRSDLFSVGVMLYEMLTGDEALRGRQRGGDHLRDHEPRAGRVAGRLGALRAG